MQITKPQQHNIALERPKPMGGTELALLDLHRYVDPELLGRVHISSSAVERPLRHLKPHILWAQQSYDQPVVQNLRDPLMQATIDMVVCVSEWQRQHYIDKLGIPASKTTVIRNATDVTLTSPKPKGNLKLIYTSTPFRGLDVLLEAFTLLNRTDVELHIYSGMSIYGRHTEDEQFRHLYERARQLPGVFFHGVVPNSEIKKVVQQSHIFAYPNTWEETSCIALIEAMSAGCLALVSDLGALPETGSGFAKLHEYTVDKTLHAQRFAKEMDQAIDAYWSPSLQSHLREQCTYFEEHYSWSTRKGEWENLLISMTA